MKYIKPVKGPVTPDFRVAEAHALQLKSKFPAEVITLVREQYSSRLDLNGYHGPAHWERVLVNGLALHQLLPDYVSPETMFIFALFHDSKRENEGSDLMHGMRGAQYLSELYEDGLLNLSGFVSPGKEKQILHWAIEACRDHTILPFSKVPQVGACLDADRLDLQRVSICPDINRLHYQTAITISLVYYCSMKAVEPLKVNIFKE